MRPRDMLRSLATLLLAAPSAAALTGSHMMLRSFAALLFAAPSSALYYAYDYNGTAPLTADTGTFVAAPRFSVLYGLQTDFNVTAELYVYAGDVCEGLADLGDGERIAQARGVKEAPAADLRIQ